MKKFLLSLLIALPFLSRAQSAGNDTTKYIYYQFTYGNALNRYWAKKVLLPPRDTIYSKDGLVVKNGIFYVGNGISWSQVTGSGGSGGSGFSIHPLTSSNFSTAVNCPIPALNNDSLQIFWNDLQRFLTEGTEWQNLSGGGFRILVPGFNATSNSYNLTLYANNIASPPGPVNFVSANFSTSVNCPITAYNGMTLQIFWNDAQRYLVQGTDWNPLAGGGFAVTIAGFNASTTNYSFYVFAQ